MGYFKCRKSEKLHKKFMLARFSSYGWQRRLLLRDSIKPSPTTFVIDRKIYSKESEKIKVEYILPNGESKVVHAEPGENLLHLAHENDVELEGACEGSLACSTCHVILDQGVFDKLEEPTDEENDMLDLAFGLTETSRLGCQVKTRKDLDGMKVHLPKATRNMAVDGYRPKPH